ncbi:MAG: SGNH hydrolase domain-containing protein, partial [Pseudomonadota bacterium]
EGQGVGDDAENLVDLARNAVSSFEAETGPEIFQGALLQTTDLIEEAGLTPVVMRQPPEIFTFSVRAAARALAYGQTTVEELANTKGLTPLELALERNAAVDQIFQAFDGQVIDTWQGICAQDQCRAMQDQEIYYFDNNHLTNNGAIAIRDSYASVFATPGQGTE